MSRFSLWHHFDYDNLNRLTRTETIGASGNTVLRYGYDGTGNRTTKTANGEETRYQNDPRSSRLIRVEGSANLVSESYEYDEVGSTVSRLNENGTDAFVYDSRGRLIQANGTNYKINTLEQRIEKRGTGANTPSGTRHFVYDEQGHLIGEYDPVSGTSMIEHIWLDDWPVAAIKDNQIYYVYPDHLGTPRAITDTSNQTVWYWNYDEPFGKTTPNENPGGTGAFSYNLRFPGQYYDEETGLHYNWYRTYAPSIGKYLESDPIGLQGGINTYGYGLNNPLKYIDPEGLSPLKIIVLCAKGYKVVKEVGFQEAIKAARRGENVLAGSHAQAKEIARAASKGKRPTRDPAHKPEEGQMPHYHPSPRTGSHVFYEIAAALTVSHYVQCEDEGSCVGSVLGSVADFFNPMAIGQDVVDIVDIISE